MTDTGGRADKGSLFVPEIAGLNPVKHVDVSLACLLYAV